MVLIMDLSTVVTSLNIVVLLGLLFIYGQTFRTTKAPFTAGLIFFAVILILQNGVALFSFLMMTPFYTQGILPFVFTIHFAELIGLSVLLKISL
ncbi:MAG: hypothetical protein ACE5KG_05235 [Nitrososphaerales archaeon]